MLEYWFDKQRQAQAGPLLFFMGGKRKRSEMRRLTFWLVLLGSLLSGPARGQAPPDPAFRRDSLFASYTAFKAALTTAAADPAALDAFWSRLRAAGQVPYAQGDSVAFLYRGPAAAVAWHGDFDAWGRAGGVASQGRRLGGSDVWILEHAFPPSARIDYKVVVGSQWLLDPANPLQVWSGFGPNSELRMPAYVYPADTVVPPGIARGVLGPPARLSSSRLGYDVTYRVYTPAGYEALSGLPVLYVTDGHEYAPPHLGSLVAVLDHLIATGEVQPLVAVFVDPRVGGTNRRQAQYADDYASFARFLADELIPAIDAQYRTKAVPGARGILGTSLGGLFATYFGAAHPNVVQRIAVQSPAYWYDTQHNGDRVYALLEAAERLPLRFYLSTGTIYDTQADALRFKALLERKGYPLTYTERPEGHSWGQWRALVGEMLRALWSPATGTSTGSLPAAPAHLAPRVFPHPVRGSATLAFELARPGRVELRLYDGLGREVSRPLAGALLPAGPQRVVLSAGAWASGTYWYRLTAGGAVASGPVVVVR